MHDLVIKGGRIIDGSGMPGFTGDVAVREGRIREVGRVSGGAARTIDASGLVVAPGFVDIHTHYDAQAFWDPLFTSSSWNGVTTVVSGNCGFTLAPVHPRDQDYLARTLAGVESISVKAIEKGVQFGWRSYGEYLGSLDRPKAINIACNIGHTAVRRYVLGDRASEGPATEDEVRHMAALVREALAAGAFCFTTSRSPTHWGPGGEPVPSRAATIEELYQLCMAARDFWNCSIEMIGVQQTPEGRELMARVSRELHCQVNWNEFNHTPLNPEGWRELEAYMSEANRQGAQVYGISRCQQNNMEFDLRDNANMLLMYRGWAEVMAKPLDEKKRLLARADVRSQLKDGLAGPGGRSRVNWAKTAVWETGLEKNRALEGKDLATLAEERRKDPVDVLFDLSLEEDLRTEFAMVDFFSSDREGVAQVLRSPYSILGISDGGAHVNTFCGALYTTYFLSKWVREWRQFTLEEAVRKLTFVPASIIGLRDRGLLRPGLAADITVFDPETVSPRPTRRVHDLPAGEPRLIVEAEGIPYVVVAGQVIFDHGKPTGALPGRLIRSSDYR